MSCVATVVATFDDLRSAPVDAEAVVARAIERLHELERRWSRFIPDSEISRLNTAPAEPHRVGPDTFRLVEHLVQAWHATGGAFDPTLLGTVIHLGYGASRDRAHPMTSLLSDTGLQGRPGSIRVRRSDRTVVLGRGTSVDPGGLGKGLAADIVVDEMLAAGAAGALVEIGGDLYVRGRPPAGIGWPISITDRDEVIAIADGGVATSTSRLRTWSRNDVTHHHLIDPVTLRSTDSGVEVCTVIAGTAAWAEALTKIAFARGADAALDEYESRGIAASIITADSQYETTTWKDFLR